MSGFPKVKTVVVQMTDGKRAFYPSENPPDVGSAYQDGVVIEVRNHAPGPQTTPCRYCGAKTPRSGGSETCDTCWPIEWRIVGDPDRFAGVVQAIASLVIGRASFSLTAQFGGRR